MAYEKGYGKRPMWQWILIYIVVGALVYGVIYYLVFAQKGGYSYSSSSTPAAQKSTGFGY